MTQARKHEKAEDNKILKNEQRREGIRGNRQPLGTCAGAFVTGERAWKTNANINSASSVCL